MATKSDMNYHKCCLLCSKSNGVKKLVILLCITLSPIHSSSQYKCLGISKVFGWTNILCPEHKQPFRTCVLEMLFWAIFSLSLYILKQRDKGWDPNRKTSKHVLTALSCKLRSFPLKPLRTSALIPALRSSTKVWRLPYKVMHRLIAITKWTLPLFISYL